MLKRIKWKPRPADIFDGDADTRDNCLVETVADLETEVAG